jgi:hypothetical protein
MQQILVAVIVFAAVCFAAWRLAGASGRRGLRRVAARALRALHAAPALAARLEQATAPPASACDNCAASGADRHPATRGTSRG